MKTAKEQLRQKLQEQLIVGQSAAKWAPREKSSKKAEAFELMKFLSMTPKFYRKSIADLSETVEDLMCSNQWNSINYSSVGSIAAARYQKAFGKHSPEKYNEYKDKLATGEAKINASSIYPYNVLQSIRSGDSAVAEAQWNSLPNYMGDSAVLPVCDVSGSMSCSVGGNANLTCMDICISLGLYMADKNTGPFKDMFLTFSDHSKIEVLRGDIISKMNQLQHADLGMSTNLNAAFTEILNVAKTNQVAEVDMPKYLCVMSDMEFNRATVDSKDVGAFELARERYAESGYVLPKIIWWNLNARAGNVPVSYNEQGTALVSGFSPALMKSILAAEEFTPESIMLTTVNAERYQVIT